MKVTSESHGNGSVFVVEGHLDMGSTSTLRNELRGALKRKSTPLVVDLTDVAFIDSSGLATLIEALQSVSHYGGRMCLCGLRPEVKRLFELAHLGSIFEVKETRDQALGLTGPA